MDGTIIQQGSFTGTGKPQIIPLRQGVDWIQVQNVTQSFGTSINNGVYYFWSTEMSSGSGTVQYHPAADHTLALAGINPPNGFTPINSILNQAGAPIPLISIDGTPVVTVASTAGLVSGDVVRIYNTVGAQQLGGLYFTINVLDGTHFQLFNMPPIAPAAGPGSFSVIAGGPLFVPNNLTITKITNAIQARVTLSVDHNYSVGDAVRFSTNADGNGIFGMTQIDGMIGNIVDLDEETITVDIDTSNFNAFTFPTTDQVPFTPAIVIPFGETASVGSLNNVTQNVGMIGMQLAAGPLSPAGNFNDYITWQAGKSFSANN